MSSVRIFWEDGLGAEELDRIRVALLDERGDPPTDPVGAQVHAACLFGLRRIAYIDRTVSVVEAADALGESVALIEDFGPVDDEHRVPLEWVARQLAHRAQQVPLST
jgi:hypothetical protein